MRKDSSLKFGFICTSSAYIHRGKDQLQLVVFCSALAFKIVSIFYTQRYSDMLGPAFNIPSLYFRGAQNKMSCEATVGINLGVSYMRKSEGVTNFIMWGFRLNIEMGAQLSVH